MPRYSDHDLAVIRNRLGESVPVPPKPRKRKNDESREQCALIAWWHHACAGYGIDERLLFAVPNGARRSVVTGAILKREGVRAGCPDLMLDVPRRQFHGLRIEMKHETGTARPDQLEFIELLRKQGYCAVVAYGYFEAKRVIELYLSENGCG